MSMIACLINRAKLFVIITLALCALSCQKEKSDNVNLLNQAAQVLEKEPQQAADLLKTIKTELLSNADFAWFTLLQARAWNTLGRDISMLETDILDIKNYFISNNNLEKSAYACFVLAYIYEGQKNQPQALYYYLQADEWAKRVDYIIPNLTYLLIPYNIASIYFRNGDYGESLVYLSRAEKHQYSEQDYVDMLYILELKGLSHYNDNMPDSAIYYYDKAIRLAKQHNDTESQIRVLYNQSLLYADLGNYQLAEEKCIETIKLVSENDSIKIGKRYISLATIYNKTGRDELGFNVLEKAEGFLKNANFSDKIPLYEIFYAVEKNRGNINKAEYYKQQMEFYQNLSDNFYKKLQTEVKQLHVENITDNKQANLSKRKIAKSGSYTILLLLACATLVLLGLVVVFVRYKRIRREKRRILEETNRKRHELEVSLKEQVSLRERAKEEVYKEVEEKTKEIEERTKEFEKKTKELDLKHEKINKKLNAKTAECDKIADKSKKEIDRTKKEKDEEINRIAEEYNAQCRRINKTYRAEIIKHIFKQRDLQRLQQLLDSIDIKSAKIEKAKDILEEVMRRMKWHDIEPMLEMNYREVFLSIREKFKTFTELEYRYACMVATTLFSEMEIMNLLQFTTENLNSIKQSLSRKLYNLGLNLYYLDDYIKIQEDKKAKKDRDDKRRSSFG